MHGTLKGSTIYDDDVKTCDDDVTTYVDDINTSEDDVNTYDDVKYYTMISKHKRQLLIRTLYCDTFSYKVSTIFHPRGAHYV